MKPVVGFQVPRFCATTVQEFWAGLCLQAPGKVAMTVENPCPDAPSGLLKNYDDVGSFRR